MANSVWQGTIQNSTGDIVPGAEISVYDEGTGSLAVIYLDIGGTALTNPFFSDSSGFAQFYADAGQYRITATETGSGLSQTWRHVRLGSGGSTDTGTASDEVPLNSDLTDVLRDSDIGQTVAGLTSPGATNWDSGNTNIISVSASGQSMAAGGAETTSDAVFKIPVLLDSVPSSITTTGTFSIKSINGNAVRATGISTILLAGNPGSSTRVASVFVSGLSGLVAGEQLVLVSESSLSKIEIN